MASKVKMQLMSEMNRLKTLLMTTEPLLSSPDLWIIHVEFQTVCSRLLITFLDFALEKGVEKDLWNIGFRQTINFLQSQSKEETSGGKGVLNCYLHSASGFYLQFFHSICSFYQLDFSFRKKDSSLGLMGGSLSEIHEVEHTEKTKKLLMYLCQYCLIHLGDLSRYRYQAKQAELFYKHAVSVSPSSGHAYNQLSLLEAGRGNKLGAVCLCMQAICVPAPFPVAPLNLSQTLRKSSLARTNSDLGEFPEVCLDKHEYSRLFLEFHCQLLIKGNLDKAKALLPRLTTSLSPLVATTSITRSNLLQMCIIGIFSHSYFSKKINLKNNSEDGEPRKEEDIFVDPESMNGAIELIEKLMVDMLCSLILPVYTIKEPSIVLVFAALPAVVILLEWLMNENNWMKLMQEQQQIWHGLCSLANALNKSLVDFDSSKYSNKPLPEHWTLQCFQPFSKAISNYKFTDENRQLSLEESNLLRAHLLVEITKKCCMQQLSDGPLIKMVDQPDGSVFFETQAKPPLKDVLDLEKLTLIPPVVNDNSSKSKMGILKSHVSNDKSTKEDQKEEKKSSVKIEVPENSRKSRKNVAMQAILKRNPTLEKQVKFKNVSPTASPIPEPNTSSSHKQCHEQHAASIPRLPLQAGGIEGSRFPSPPVLMPNCNVNSGPPNLMFNRLSQFGVDSATRETVPSWPEPTKGSFAQTSQTPPPSLLGYTPSDIEPRFPIPKRFDQPPPNWDKNPTFNPVPTNRPPPQSVLPGAIPMLPPNLPPFAAVPSLFSRPPPPITSGVDPVGSYRPRNNMGPIPPLMQIGNESFASDEAFRTSSGYSLFGPLGATMDVHNASLPIPTQQAMNQSHKNPTDRLWSGPSPLQRLLEQKKISSTKNFSNPDSFK